MASEDFAFCTNTNELDDSSSSDSCSQMSSSIPSPKVIPVERHLPSSQTSSVPSFSSQTSSLPSPHVTNLDKLLGNRPCPCDHDINQLCSKIESLDSENRNKVLSLLLVKSEKQDLVNMPEETVNHVSKLLGEYCRDKIKSEAASFRFKRSREESDLSSVEILSKRLKIEPLHIFYECATGKSGRNISKYQEKVAPHQATFYESLLKGANLQTLGPFNLARVNKLKLKVTSKAVFENQVGGSYSFHQHSRPTTPLQMSHKGPLIREVFKISQ